MMGFFLVNAKSHMSTRYASKPAPPSPRQGARYDRALGLADHPRRIADRRMGLRLYRLLRGHRPCAVLAGEGSMLMGDPTIDLAIVVLGLLLILAFCAALWPMDRY